jgi:putative transposase
MPKYRRVFKENHSYFLTITTYQRNPILIKNIELLRESFRRSKEKYNYNIDAIVILPEHFHLLLTPQNATDYPKIIASIKAYFSMHCDEKYYAHLEQTHSRHKKRYKAVWQKKYYEQTIKNEKDFNVHLKYIYNNPVKHGLVEKSEDWVYSSFYVR